MGCCSPFSAANSRPAADPSRHVNFTTGMVLGVDDHVQEFTYHSARDKWMVRDFLGYGTLSGLALTVEEDGANGPRIRVSPGSAAAPSGQLICVGREQCGSLNAWLGRADVAEKVRELTEATATPDAGTLNLFLTLCYVDCPVADVPIPGEPCRSDENLMAPSRIADDYCLELAFEPPPMAEAMAVSALGAFWTTLSFDAGEDETQAALDIAVGRAELQLRLALGLADPDAPAPGAGDLDPVKIHPGLSARYGAALKRLWVTRIRPLVAAQGCGADAVPAHDCVLLGRLTVPVVKVDTHWEVESPPPDDPPLVQLDESDRPLLLAASASQTAVGAAMEAGGGGQQIAFLTADGPTPFASGLVVVRSASPVTVDLPPADAASLGKTLIVKAADEGEVTLSATAPTFIDGATTLVLPIRGAASLISDGANTWHVTGQVH